MRATFKYFLPILVLATSCKSFLISGKEVLDNVYVWDKNGCMKEGVAITTKPQLSCDLLSFYLNSNRYQIKIPHLELNWGQQKYSGYGLDHNLYTVTFTDIKKSRRIDINWENNHIVISNENICTN